MKAELAVLLIVGVQLGPFIDAAHAGQSGGQPTALRIVVIEGEDAINVVQQKTAVAPVVEVHDRNDQPVAGAVVRFAIRGGRATFNGPRVLTVTTNAAGRAAVTSLTPTGSGVLQIGATATFQGQTAAITIAQTNVMTMTEAAAASAGTAGSGAGAGGAGGGAGGSSAGGAAGGAGGAGGGLSTTTIAVVSGAAAGGALAAKEVLGSQFTHYEGPFSGSSVSIASPACTITQAHAGKVVLDIKTGNDGTVSGTGSISETRTTTQAQGCGSTVPIGGTQDDGSGDQQVTGTTGNLRFSGSHGGGANTNWTYDFSGSLSGDTVTGTFVLTVTSPTAPTINPSFPVTATKSKK